MDSERAVGVVRFTHGQRRVGSGYRIAGQFVLTAAHCVTGSGHQVLLADGVHPARVVADGGRAVDVALLEILPGGTGAVPVTAVTPTPCARVDRRTAGRLSGCVAVGFPQFAAHTTRPFTTAQVDGWIPTASGMVDAATGRHSGYLVLRTEGAPPRGLSRAESYPGKTPWAGMSGAAVFASGFLIGVITEHHLPEGDGSLTVVPIDWAGRIPDSAGRALMLSVLEAASVGGLQVLSAPASLQAAAGVPAVAPARPVADWKARDLGVHLPIDTAPDGEMPSYIRRLHDLELRKLLSAQHASRMVVLVGGSCTGKSRACFEAARECLGNRDMVRPSDAAELERALTGAVGGGHQVIWLDEADVFLDGRLQRGAEAAQCLQRGLADGSRTLLVIGSMRAERWAELTDPPRPGMDDLHVHARRLLGMGAVRRLEVPPDFSGAGPAVLRDLKIAGERDSRLATARRSAGDALRVIQVLAGGPLLVERYQHRLAPHSATIITAAMDARRLGHWAPVPPLLLEDAASGYLTAAQRTAPPHWLRESLDAAAESVLGVRALAPVRHRPGIGNPDGYVLHDYLDEYAREARAAAAPPASLWDALLTHTADADDLARIADEARQRGLYRYAVRAAARAAAAGHIDAVFFVARLLVATGRAAECITWLVPFAEAGNTDAMVFLSGQLQESGGKDQLAKGISWLEQAARAGNKTAMWELGELYANDHFARQLPELVEKGLVWLRPLAKEGHPDAVRRLAEVLERVGQTTEARFWRERCAPSVTIASESVLELFRQVDLIGAPRHEDISQLRSRAAARDLKAMEDLGVRLDRAGQVSEGIEWLTRATEAGHYHAAWELSQVLHREGREEEALATVQRAAAIWGDDWTSLDLVLNWLARTRGRPAVKTFLTAAASAKNGWAAVYLARELYRDGNTAQAISWLRPAAERENLGAMEALGVLLEQTHGEQEAHSWYRNVDQAADAPWLYRLACMLEDFGWLDRALLRLRQLVECNYYGTMDSLARVMKKAGRMEEARLVLAFGIDAGGTTAKPWRLQDAS